ncbi:hypothetical protein ACNVJZ_001502 [Cronobacter sakazakii]
MNNDELIAAGHELAKCLDSNTPLIDIAKLLSKMATQLNVTAAELREKTKQCEELAAENAVLKSKGRELLKEVCVVYGKYNASIDPENGNFMDGQTLHEFQFLMDFETPATDAFLREVRAQVWIEGNEPPEFGRYWVRYETDVGPQYCSAKWMEYNFCAGSDTNIHKIWLDDLSRSITPLRGVTHYTKLPPELEAAHLRQGGAA